MYFKIYCPVCSKPDPYNVRGLCGWVYKYVLRRRMFRCRECGHVFTKKRRNIFRSILGDAFRVNSSWNNDLPLEAFETMRFEPRRIMAKVNSPAGAGGASASVDELQTRMQEKLERIARNNEELIRESLKLVNEKEEIYIRQQREMLKMQENMTEMIKNLGDVFEKATGQRLPAFTVIDSTESGDEAASSEIG